MQSGESGAPWPYARFEAAHDEEGKPIWQCPGGECPCHPPQSDADSATGASLSS